MWQLFRSECYQILRNKSFYASILISGIVFYLFYNSDLNMRTIAELRDVTGESWNLDMIRNVSFPVLRHQFGITEESFTGLDDMMSIYFKYVISFRFLDPNACVITSAYLSTVLLGTSFEHRTIDLGIMQGYSRRQIFGAKAILYYLLALCNTLFWFFVLHMYTFGVQGTAMLPRELIFKCYLVVAYNVLVVYTVPFLLTMLTRNILKSALLNFAFLFLAVVVSNLLPPAVYTIVFPFLSYGHFLRSFAFPEFYPIDPMRTVQYLSLSLGYLIGFNWLAYRVFHKAELK